VSDLTERVARALYEQNPHARQEPWDDDQPGGVPHDYWRGKARAALAVVADDVDGLAGVLRAHLHLEQDSRLWSDDERAAYEAHAHESFDAARTAALDVYVKRVAREVAAHLRGA
jgi:hypothetical protein